MAMPWIPLLLLDEVSDGVEIGWVEKSGLVITSPQYSGAGFLTGLEGSGPNNRSDTDTTNTFLWSEIS